MAIRSPSLAVDIARAESARFRHPLLLLHGLWTGGWIWSDTAAYLAHRGWESWIPSFDGTSDAADRLQQVIELCRNLPAAPIILAHDAAAVMATKLAASTDAPAIIVISPLLSRSDGGSLGIFARPQFWAARSFAKRVHPPRGGARKRLLGGLDQDSARLRPDSGRFFRLVLAGDERIAAAVPRPGLLVSTAADPLLTPSAAEHLAGRLGWSFDLHGTAGHFPIRTPGWERLADRLHRWLVRTLGEDLLLLLDDESESE